MSVQIICMNTHIHTHTRAHTHTHTHTHTHSNTQKYMWVMCYHGQNEVNEEGRLK